MVQTLLTMILASNGAYLLPTVVSGTSWTRSGVFRFRNGQSETGMTLNRARAISETKIGTKYACTQVDSEKMDAFFEISVKI